MEAKGFSEVQLVIFRLGSEEYGVPITQVQEIIHYSPPRKMPGTPPFVEGIINLRGKVIPVIDLKKRFELKGTEESSEDARIVVVDVGGHTVGVIVDEVSEVLRLPSSSIDPPPPIIAGIAAEYLWGVGKLQERLLILVDLEKILTEREKGELEKAESKLSVKAGE
ncbi:MAG: chemotaxis protein CheW [Thermacetogeniaceae bacterium]